jgi:2'-5' RNA ligase
VLLRGRHTRATLRLVWHLVEHISDARTMPRLPAPVAMDVLSPLLRVVAARRLVRVRMVESRSSYRPFIDDPDDIARFEGQRFVVLRATGAVADAHRHVRSLLKEQIADGDASYLAQAHVTLTGFPKGTHLDSVRDLVTDWARLVAPLQLEVEKAGYFPSPFQIVILQMRKTTALCDALVSLRARAKERALGDAGMVHAADWIFHMSVAYCSSLGSPAWTAVTEFVDRLSVPAAQCVVGEVEIVAVDNGQEYSGGVFDLSAMPAQRD